MSTDAKTRPAKRKHYTGNYEWYTPAKYVEAVRRVLGEIDLDPASCAEADEVVKATRYYSKADDGLTLPWHGRVFSNPPYGAGIIGEFCDKLVAELDAGHTTAAIFLVNSSTDTAWWHRLAVRADHICFCRGRIRYTPPRGNQSRQPIDGQSFLYYGDDVDCFREEFREFGMFFGPIRGRQQAVEPADNGDAHGIDDVTWI